MQSTSTVGAYAVGMAGSARPPVSRRAPSPHGVLHVVVHGPQCPLVNEGRHGRLGVGGVADDEGLGPPHELVEHGVRHRGVHVDALDRGAELAGVREGTDRHLLGGPDRVDIRVDDEGVLAAVLGDAGGAPAARRPAARTAPAALLPMWATMSTDGCAGERGAGDGIPLDELEDAVGKAPGDEVGQPAPRCGAALRRLVDDGVARDERGRDEAGGGGVGVVPGGDDPDDASWLGAHEVHGARSRRGAPARSPGRRRPPRRGGRPPPAPRSGPRRAAGPSSSTGGPRARPRPPGRHSPPLSGARPARPVGSPAIRVRAALARLDSAVSRGGGDVACGWSCRAGSWSGSCPSVPAAERRQTAEEQKRFPEVE